MTIFDRRSDPSAALEALSWSTQHHKAQDGQSLVLLMLGVIIALTFPWLLR